MMQVLSLEFLGGILIFAGNALSLFLLSPRKYSSRATMGIWAGVFALSSLLSVIFYGVVPAGGAVLLSQAVSLGLCAPVFLITSQGNFLKNVFLFTTYINIFLYSIAAAQAIAASFIDNNPVAVIEFRLIFLTVFWVVLVYDIRPAFDRAAKNIPRGWGSLTVLVCVFSGRLCGKYGIFSTAWDLCQQDSSQRLGGGQMTPKFRQFMPEPCILQGSSSFFILERIV